VDVADDAQQLLDAGCAVEASHCEAVLDLLVARTPVVDEMWLLLRLDGREFVCMLFREAYHRHADRYKLSYLARPPATVYRPGN